MIPAAGLALPSLLRPDSTGVRPWSFGSFRVATAGLIAEIR